MKLKYLGTAAAEGWPAVFCSCQACADARRLGGKNIRSRSQAMLDDDLLLDYPPDSFLHSVQHGVDFSRVKHLLVTHCHEDHLYLDDLFLRRNGFSSMEESEKLTVYGNDTLLKKFLTYQEQDSLKEVSRYTSAEELTEYRTAAVGEYQVTPLPADHNPKEKCFIYLISKDGKTLLYAHDTGYLKESVWEYLSGRHLDLVSLDCNHMQDDVRHNHMGILCCNDVKKRLEETGICGADTKFILNHFSHNSRVLHEPFTEIAHDYGFEVSFDGMEIEI